ncbi:hypothetical protein B0T18DRAFT_315201 [Schizothecium vesticola]|uniref:Capsule polysaccharide biosynthesis protein n=1 Tax=Schizothecium vesticola TaxID=314040 RepID=A0AA40FC43_9PEZI|nr:hypothetical protein B0T18DRAFT_315201 [Schizothecium vesticola]
MGRVGNLNLLLPIGIPTTLAGLAYAGHWALHFDWKSWLKEFLSGPGRTSRILLVIFLALNWKSLPLGWTFRILSSFTYHYARPRPPLPPRALFHYAITTSYTTPLETDYNLHKSNSTYFADVDVSRSHLVTHLLGAAVPRLPGLVRDRAGNPVPGSVGIGLGAVFCSFRRELAPLRRYEMWSRVLSWDRKWMYIVTHFVPAGLVRPTGWDGRSGGATRERVVRAEDGREVAEEEMSKYVCATAVSKYVFKLGRFTVHPAIVFEAAGVLPERPGEGWRGGEDETGGGEELGEVDEREQWDWKRVERERRRGLVLAKHFHALDQTNSLFDGGEDGAMGRFPLG